MLLISYGITKSGSTLGFELSKAILENAGHKQVRLPDGIVEPGHRINFVNRLNENKIRNLINTIGPHRIIAVKTHAGFPQPMLPFLEEQISEGNILVQAVYRDPREICLSLLDAGQSARNRRITAALYRLARKTRLVSNGAPAQSRSLPFAEIKTLEDAARVCSKQLVKFRKWKGLPGTLSLPYNELAFGTKDSIVRIDKQLGTDSNHAQILSRVMQRAFTQKNRAVPDRYKDELTVRQNEQLAGEFREFIDSFT